MGVRIPAEKNLKIVFHYKTPGLSQGIAISLLSLAAFALYMSGIIIFRVVSAKRQNKRNGEM